MQLEHGLIGAAGDGRVGTATRRDYTAAAAVVLTSGGHDDAVDELSGDTAWTFDEYAAELSRQSGTDVRYQRVSVEDLTAILAGAGLSQEQAAIFAEIDLAIERGEFQGAGGDLARLIGRPTTPMTATMARAHGAFRVA